ncbi:hypothetical protein E2C01_082164 [Portunus trituberculatus]|uniref:Uncharacterized protein n=1 Tax=Portunus trituberculatus TaxID=210409 RepID=A0A5B7J029_PORTR|nr:hypothetical protein [Portunus trituberculatus]
MREVRDSGDKMLEDASRHRYMLGDADRSSLFTKRVRRLALTAYTPSRKRKQPSPSLSTLLASD